MKTARQELQGIIEFGLLGAGKPGDYRRPRFVDNFGLPKAMAAYEFPSETAGPHGTIHKGTGFMGPDLEKGSRFYGYKSAKGLPKAMRRHEIFHSIRASKRNYKPMTKIRDLIAEEVGAYSTMHRANKVKSGGMLGKALRAADGMIGVPISTAIGVASNPDLQKRAVMRGKQTAAVAGAGAILGGGYLALRKKKPEEKKLSAREELNSIISLSD